MPQGKRRQRLTHRRSKSAPPSISTAVKPRQSTKRKKWTEEGMKKAIEAVETGGSGVNRAALDHGIPKSTLKDRISGRVLHGRKPGPKPYLTPVEEKELAEFVKSCAGLGYGKTRKDVLNVVESVAIEKGVLVRNKISDGWWRRFLERQDVLTLFRGDSTECYNIFTDEDYVWWLKLYHPQFLPDEVLNDLSVLAHISSVSPQTPLLICNEEAPLPVTITAASMSPAVASSKDVTTVSTTSSGSDSTVSKFLVHPTDNTPVRTIQKPIPRARLLTSAASLAAIEEKEKQKQEQLEEKQSKRREREEKKKQKEQELKRKEEERVKKAKEKARKTKTNSTKKVAQDKKEHFNIREQAQRGKRRKPLDFDQDIPQAKKSKVT